MDADDKTVEYDVLSDGYANWPIEGNIPDDERGLIVKTLLALANLISTPSRYPDKRYEAFLRTAFGREMQKLSIEDIVNIRRATMDKLLMRVVEFYESGNSTMLFDRIRDWEVRDK